jgi:hypothetical protein
MTPEQRAEHLKHSNDMATVNDTIAEEGESHVSLLKLFFISFVFINRLLIEMNALIYILYVLLMLTMNFMNSMVDIHTQ